MTTTMLARESRKELNGQAGRFGSGFKPRPKSDASMEEAGCWTRPELLLCGGAPRRNRTGDHTLTMDRRPSAVLTRVLAGRSAP
jgi:hypothetical protein